MQNHSPIHLAVQRHSRKTIMGVSYPPPALHGRGLKGQNWNTDLYNMEAYILMVQMNVSRVGRYSQRLGWVAESVINVNKYNFWWLQSTLNNGSRIDEHHFDSISIVVKAYICQNIHQ